MLGGFVHMMEVTLIILAAIVAYRIYHLYQSYQIPQAENEKAQILVSKLVYGKISTNYEYDAKMAALKDAQIFSGTQLLPIKRCYGDLKFEKFVWLRKTAAFYLIGAIEHIANCHHCNATSTKQLTTLVLKSNLGIPSHIVDDYINEALDFATVQLSSEMAIVGESAVKFWLTGVAIPKHMTLEEYLNRAGIMA